MNNKMDTWMDGRITWVYSNSGLFCKVLTIRVRHIFQESNSLSVEHPISFLSKKGNDCPLLAVNRGIIPTKFFSTYILKPYTHGQEPRAASCPQPVGNGSHPSYNLQETGSCQQHRSLGVDPVLLNFQVRPETWLTLWKWQCSINKQEPNGSWSSPTWG